MEENQHTKRKLSVERERERGKMNGENRIE